jgi:RNA polymerase primary sigma factor
LKGFIAELKLNPARIEELVELHNVLNRKVAVLERNLAAAAEGCGIKREEFAKIVNEQSLQPEILISLAVQSETWKDFAHKQEEVIEELFSTIKDIEAQTYLPFGEFRRIVNAIQRGEREASRAKKEMIEANLRLVI